MKIRILLPLFSMILLAPGCHIDEAFYEMTSPGFAKVSSSLTDFKNSVGKTFSEYNRTPGVPPADLNNMDKLTWQLQHGGDIHFEEHYASDPRGALNFWVDGRNSDGLNTWNHPSLSDKFYDGKIDYVTSGGGATGGVVRTPWGGGALLADFSKTYKVRLPLNGPPAYLHLCLDSWDEYTPNQSVGKTWLVQSIVDLDGKEYLPDDPQWGPYLDNKFRFEKSDRFIIYPGETYTETEKKYFNNKTEIFGTYRIEKPDKLTILALLLPPTGLNGEPSMIYAFFVLESGFNKPLVVTGILEGKFGKVTLVREN